VKRKLPHPEEQDRGGPVLVNRYRRAIQITGVLGARVQAGSFSAAGATGVGDCLLLNFSQQFFAVADGSDRNPSFSREFMKKFAALLTGTLTPARERIYEDRDIRALKRHLMAESDRLLQSFSFGDGCTFTGILFLRTREGMTGLLFHTGDSLLFSCNLQTGRTRQWSKNNFWMAGRTSRFFQVEDRSIRPHTHLLLATDGLTHIPFPSYKTREASIRSLFKTLSPEAIPDHLLGIDDIPKIGWDDLAIITFNPCSLPVRGSFLLGGTSRIEENIFQEEKRKGCYQDRYLPLEIDKGEEVPSVDL
jgi:hypothetical protein